MMNFNKERKSCSSRGDWTNTLSGQIWSRDPTRDDWMRNIFQFFLIFSLPLSYVTFNVDAIIFFAHKKLKKPVQKVAYLWQLGVYFLCSPDCPKQPRTSFPLYEFSQTISSRIKWKISSKLSTEPLGTLYYVCIDQYKIKVLVFSIQCAFEILKYYVSVLNLKNIGK